MIDTATIQVRHLQDDDVVPFADLARGGPLGFEQLPLDPELTWVAIHDSKIVGILICGQCSLLLFLVRIAVTPTSPASTPLVILRSAFTDARRRGFVGYVTFLSDSAAAESHLMRIVQRADGGLLPASGAWAYGGFTCHSQLPPSSEP